KKPVCSNLFGVPACDDWWIGVSIPNVMMTPGTYALANPISIYASRNDISCWNDAGGTGGALLGGGFGGFFGCDPKRYVQIVSVDANSVRFRLHGFPAGAGLDYDASVPPPPNAVEVDGLYEATFCAPTGGN